MNPTKKKQHTGILTSRLLMLCGMLFFVYIFLLGDTIFDVVGRKVAEQESRDLLAEISSLEISALDLYNDLSVDEAKNLGFVESTPHFASKNHFVVR
jgi:hypothetical protein